MSKRPKHDDPEEAPEIETAEQAELDISIAAPAGPVECLGMTFPSDAARRGYFLKELAKKLKDPAFRKIEGFPIGEDEDILALSDPPYYTACPNPWLADFVTHYGKPYNPKEKYHREPFAADVSEGKNHPVYMAHAYHTKVPHRAIMRYILHYTEPGDFVFDGFAGTGMTGVAAALCGDRDEVQALGYKVLPDGRIADAAGTFVSRLGSRRAVLNDLSPAASFIAYNYNDPCNPEDFSRRSAVALSEAQERCDWMFTALWKAKPHEAEFIGSLLKKCQSSAECQTLLKDIQTLRKAVGDTKSNLQIGRINYTTWSDVFSCPECGNDVIFWDAAVSESDWQVSEDFQCPKCHAALTKSRMERVWRTYLDRLTGKPQKIAKQVPVLINGVFNREKFCRKPDAFDMELLNTIERLAALDGVQLFHLPPGDKMSDPQAVGIEFFHQFYTWRNLAFLSAFAGALGETRFFGNITSACLVLSKMYRFRSQGGSLGAGGGPMNGTLYVPSLIKEIPAPKVLEEHICKAIALRAYFRSRPSSLVQTASFSSWPNAPAEVADYLFLDPPFGSNLMYSELNFISESWLRVKTNSAPEAIENRTQKKTSGGYRDIMRRCFGEAYRILKPGRWLTVEFSNTKAEIWNGIQSALQEAGFVVANVSALDKKQLAFNPVNNPTSVKQDLVISAYKPTDDLEARFAKRADTADGVWDFIRSHLANLPIVKPKGGQLEPIPERDARILFDRAVAFYIRHGIPVPISSPEFQASLVEKFPERDGMYFLADQAAEYDKVRMKMEGLGQLTIFVDDERSAVDWLRNYLKNKPSKYNDVQPEFFGQLNQSWKQWETKPELRALLDQYFLCYQGEGEVPSQIHSYLSTNFKELRMLPADHAMLRAKARDRWFVPDPRKNADVEQLREKHLLDEFWSYLPPGYEAAARTRKPIEPELPGMQQTPPKQPKGKRIAIVRTEAIRVGFNFCYGRNDYATIIAVAQHIPADVIHNDEQLQMIYDGAVTRTGGEPE